MASGERKGLRSFILWMWTRWREKIPDHVCTDMTRVASDIQSFHPGRGRGTMFAVTPTVPLFSFDSISYSSGQEGKLSLRVRLPGMRTRTFRSWNKIMLTLKEI